MNGKYQVIENEKLVLPQVGDSHTKWHYCERYNIYAQKVNGNIFVTFYNADGEKVHFNDSGSVCVSEFYGKFKTLEMMFAWATESGWVAK